MRTSTKEDNIETHAVQIFDEPRQSIALQLRQTIPVVIPAKEVGELLVKVRRGSVEVVELLDHEGAGQGADLRRAVLLLKNHINSFHPGTGSSGFSSTIIELIWNFEINFFHVTSPFCSVLRALESDLDLTL